MTPSRQDDPQGPLKVVCFLFDPNTGGPTIRARQVSEALVPEGVEVVFAMPGTDGSARGFLEERGFRVHDLGVAKPVMPTRPLAFLKFAVTAPLSVARIARFLRRERPDVVHINGAFDILPALAGRLAGVPVLWHLNDMVFGARLSRALGAVVRRVARVPVVSAAAVAGHYGLAEADPALLPVPVDTDRYTPREGPPAPPVALALIGNWNPLKGQRDLLDVIEALRGQGHAVEGRVAGRLLDSQRAYWEPLVARAEAAGGIAVEGFVGDVPGFLARSDILLIPSVSEAGPMSCIEAMASAVPVVAYDVGDVRTMLDPDGPERCGIVVPRGDRAAMTAAAASLAGDPALYAALSANGPARARRLYDTRTVALATRDAYARAAGKR